MIKTCLRYPGGKTRLVKRILEITPNKINEFREPFVGGGSVFVGLIQQKQVQSCLINDIYTPLYNFWKLALQEENSFMINEIKRIKENYPRGKDIFEKMRKKISQDSFWQSVSFFILNRITFSGTIEAGGYSEQSFKGRFTDSSIKRLNQIKNLKKHCKIDVTNEDYEKIIKKPGKDVFIFLDPPYYSAKKSKLYGKKGENHVNFDFERLSKTLKNTKHKWLMTIDNSDYIKNLFSFANMKEFDLQYGMGNSKGQSKKGKELFISNYEI